MPRNRNGLEVLLQYSVCFCPEFELYSETFPKVAMYKIDYSFSTIKILVYIIPIISYSYIFYYLKYKVFRKLIAMMYICHQTHYSN